MHELPLIPGPRKVVIGAVLVAVGGAALVPLTFTTAPVVAATAASKPDTSFAAVPAGTYVMDTRTSSLVFQVAHYGGLSRPLLRFRVFSAEYNWDPAKPNETKVKARIEHTSFDSGYQDMDIRMNAPDVLGGYDVPSTGPYAPPYTFESTEVKFSGQKDKNGGLLGTMKGDLIMTGESRPVSMEFVYNGTAKDSEGLQKTGFSARGSLKRSTWGQTSVPTAGDDVDFQLELEFALKGSSRFLRGPTT